MKKILVVLALSALAVGCEVEDKYYGPEVTPSDSTVAPDDSKIDWEAAADFGTEQLVDKFWKTSDNGFVSNTPDYHFTVGVKGVNDPNNNYWVNAHGMDVVIDAYLRTGDAKYKEMLDNGYKYPIGDGTRDNRQGVLWTSYGDKSRYGQISPCFGNPFIDDMEWHALTLTRAYEATGEAVYLHEAQKLFDQIWTIGWDPDFTDVGGNGGFLWSYSADPSKNACSNNPGCLLASRMYELSQRADYAANSLPQYLEEDYLAKAKMSYDWIRSMLFNPQTGMTYGGVNANGVDKAFTLSYDQGTFIAAAHHLYKATGDYVYARDAQKAVEFAMGDHITSDGILRDEGAGGDNSTFKGIFMRYATAYVNDKAMDKATRIALHDFLKHNAITLWTDGMAFDENGEPYGLFTPDWRLTEEEAYYSKGGAYTSPLLGWQTSGATTMEMMCILKDPRKE